MSDQYIGKRMGSYDVVELIGKGGMASVYRGHQPSMNRSVAIKIMAQQFSSDASFVARFKNEAHLIAQLEHAHILPVFDFGEQDGVLYIVMRYLSAGTLGDRIPENGMEIKDAVRLFRQLASALDYAHKRGVIHRDMKPGNVLVDDQGNAFLTDFGIAKSLESETNLTGTGGVVGTPTYMSPEQGLGEPLDGRSDIYALGVILFEMLTGRAPFTADNPMAVMLKHINDAPPAPSTFNPRITEAVEAVINRSLAKDRNQRYATAGDMADAFEEAYRTGSVPVQAAAFTSPEATLKVKAQTAQAATAGAGADEFSGPTMRSPIAGQPAASTAMPAGATVQGMGQPVIPMPMPTPGTGELPRIAIDLNSPSAWLAQNEWAGQWLQAALLSIATFLILLRLTPREGIAEIALLSVLPGLLYGVLRAPTLGALIAYVLILIPLAANAPGLAVIWTVLVVIAGARLNSREIMLTLITIIAASNPIGWVVPLLAPWWLKVRRVALPMALGVTFATFFALMLGWPTAGGLLPVPPEIAESDLVKATLLGDFSTTYLGLLEPAAWSGYTEPGAALGSIKNTILVLGETIASTAGMIIVLATIWSLASVLSVSNRRSEHPMNRAMGLGLGLIVLIVGHLVLARTTEVALPRMSALTIIGGLIGAMLAFLLSQWPVQADPNAGNLPGTVLRMLRQSMGAVFMALGVAFFMKYLSQEGLDSSLYPILWIGGLTGTLTMITNPMLGPPIVFASLVAALAPVPEARVLTILTAAVFFGYFIVNLLFDKRRPRQWNPLGAGFILGAPGMSVSGLLPLGPLSIGALEAQVPAAILAALGHALLIGTATDYNPVFIIMQLITTLTGVLLVERLMATPLLGNLDHKLRRLIFTVPLAAAMAVMYFGIARIDTEFASPAPLGIGLLVSVVSAAALVAGMGERARYWRTFIEREEEEKEIAEDEEVTGGGVVRRAAS